MLYKGVKRNENVNDYTGKHTWGMFSKSNVCILAYHEYQVTGHPIQTENISDSAILLLKPDYAFGLK